MDGPEVLVSHYASLAFYTRIAALTFVGAIMGTMLDKIDLNEPRYNEPRYLAGIGILLVVAALAEFNHRYTYAYVAAVYAASNRAESPAQDAAVVARWRQFGEFNEMNTAKSARGRFRLSWVTYIPGFLLGEYLLLRTPALAHGLGGLPLGALLLSWAWVSFRRYPTDASMKKKKV